MNVHDLDLFRKDVTVRGKPALRLSVIDAGRNEDPEAPAILFVHGFGGYALQWAFQMLAFAGTHRVVAVDLRGHGLSDRPRGRYAVEDFSADLARVVEALELPPAFTLVGHSFGGAIAATFAADVPERVSRLVLIGTSVDFFSLHPGARMALTLPAQILEPVRSRLFPKRFAAPSHVLTAMYRDALRHWRGDPVFARIRQPALVIMGERDETFHRRAYDAVPDRIPGAQVVKVSVSAHLVHLERPEAVNRAIGRFIGTPPGARRHEIRPAAPEASRPWIHHYEHGVAPVLGYPSQPVHRLLEAAARRFPRRPALVFHGRRCRYETLRHAADRLANGLIARGLEKGDRVAVLLGTCPALVLAHAAVHQAGGVVVSLDPATEPAERVAHIEETGARVLIADPDLLHERPWSRPPSTLEEVLWGETRVETAPLPVLARGAGRLVPRAGGGAWPDGVRVRSLRSVIETAWRRPPHVPLEPDDPASIEFSSGTTGPAQPVTLTHRNLLANVVQIRHWLQDLEDGREVMLAALGLWHSYGVTACMNLGLSVAATLVLVPEPTPAALLGAIARHRPTLFPGVPEMYRQIAAHPRVRRFDLRSIRACMSGAAPLPVEVQEVFERLTRGRLVEGYGLTEAGPVTHVNPIYGTRKRGSIGVPLPDTDARIVDPASRAPLPAGAVGELEVRGPQVSPGYWQRPELTARRIRDGWLATGDAAVMDADGFFHLKGRLGDVVATAEGAVWPREVEEVLFECPEVADAAVALDGSAGAPALVAWVAPRGGQAVDPERVLAHCRERLPPHALPARVEVRPALPRTRLGKLERERLAGR